MQSGWMRAVLFLALLILSAGVGVGQPWPHGTVDLFGPRGYDGSRDRRVERPSRQFQRPFQKFERPSWEVDRGEGGENVRYGGPRPAIKALAPITVAFPHSFAGNSIVIVVAERKLYYVLADNRAYAYPIGVGREGFGWTGTEAVSRKQMWPDWRPPPEMRERDSSLPEKMTGGLKNPLGVMAIYLGATLYRIHGTNDANSIGRAESSGCFRMLNSAVLHLASITEIGTPITVVTALPSQQVSPPTETQAPSAAVEPRALSPPEPLAANNNRTAPDYRSLRDYTLQTR